VEAAFAHGQYEHVELLALRESAQLDSLPEDDQVAVRLTVGYALIMLDREHDAREWFRRALDVKPALRLDPIQVSPRFRAVFDELQATYVPRQDHARADSVMATSAPRRSSVLLNLAVPGFGQWREAHRTRGVVLAAVQAAAAGICVWRLSELRDSRDAYLAQTDRTRVRRDYAVYRTDYRAAWISGLAAGVVYIGIQTDLALSRREHPGRGLSLAPMVNPAAVGLAVTLRY